MEQKMGYHEYIDELICPFCDSKIEDYWQSPNKYHNIDFTNDRVEYVGYCPHCHQSFPIWIVKEYKYTTGIYIEEE